MPSYLFAKLGWIDWQKWAQSLMISSLKLVKEATPAKMEIIGNWVVENNLWKKRRVDSIARLTDHIAQGAQVYIASSAIEPYVEPFAKRVGAKAIGSPVEYVNGRVRVAGDLVAQERKIEQVLTRLNVTRIDVAYGDTEQDIPMLEHADHPVAVYPDEKLKAAALERGWEILGSREK
jgi:phosphoserine phosphatase